ncbi:hypothetical protein Agub_g10790 [Astrephomene gubernaculifera]|uniref:Uncharacterized protein n=1 Tax=Astrephomene gubernaculifera TaxID=47775 RepID=A0AAD3DXZ5_9CHLO|nr:hypothetical protein Agub_g10790 [Astrephomene gubernaculifera]
MFDVQGPRFLSELRVKNRFLRRNFRPLLDGFFGGGTPKRSAVVIVSHSGTIANMLYSHTGKDEEQVLKPRNASVIAIDASGCLDLRHEGTLPECKSDEWHEYFTVPQFQEFASDIQFEYTPPESCLLLLVRHGIAVNNVNKAYADGNLTQEGEASIVKAALRISQLLQQYDIKTVSIFSSALMRTRHSSTLLYDTLGFRQLSPMCSLPCPVSSCASEGEGEGPWLQGAISVGVSTVCSVRNCNSSFPKYAVACYGSCL